MEIILWKKLFSAFSHRLLPIGAHPFGQAPEER
jgi:hypothetical protein